MNATMTYDVSIMNRTSGIAFSILACPAFNVSYAGDKLAERLHEITDARTQIDAGVRDTREEIAPVRRDLGQLKHHAPDKVRSDSAQVNHESTERSADLPHNLATQEEGMQPRVGPSVAFVTPLMGQVGRNIQTPDSSASCNPIHIQLGNSLWKIGRAHV